MDEITLKILTYLYNLNNPLEQTEILDFIKSLGLNDIEIKKRLGHLQDSLQYAVFGGINTLPNSNNYNWYWNSLGETNPRYGLQTLSGMTSLTGRIKPEGIKYIEDLNHKNKTFNLQTDSNEIAKEALRISREGKEDNKQSTFISFCACLFGALSLMIAILSTSYESQYKAYLCFGIAVIVGLIFRNQLLSIIKKRQ